MTYEMGLGAKVLMVAVGMLVSVGMLVVLLVLADDEDLPPGGPA